MAGTRIGQTNKVREKCYRCYAAQLLLFIPYVFARLLMTVVVTTGVIYVTNAVDLPPLQETGGGIIKEF